MSWSWLPLNGPSAYPDLLGRLGLHKLDEIREAAGEQISKNTNDYRGMQPVIKVYDSKAPRQTDLDLPQVSRTDRPRGQEPQVVR